jgi:glutathione peroxidase-family protein
LGVTNELFLKNIELQKMTKKQIAEAFSKHDFETTYPFINENIQWSMVGGENIIGKENVLKTCNESSNYLNTVKTNFIKFLILESENHIIIDSISEYIDQDNNVSKVASCDIYKFKKERLIGITSYCIELNKAII